MVPGAPKGWTPFVTRSTRFLSGHLMALVATIVAAGLMCDEHSFEVTDILASSWAFNGSNSRINDLKRSNWEFRKSSKSDGEKELIV